MKITEFNKLDKKYFSLYDSNPSIELMCISDVGSMGEEEVQILSGSIVESLKHYWNDIVCLGDIKECPNNVYEVIKKLEKYEEDGDRFSIIIDLTNKVQLLPREWNDE